MPSTLTNAVDSTSLTTAIGGSAPAADDTVLLNRFASDYIDSAGADVDANAITLFHALAGWSGNGGWNSQTGAFANYVKVKTNATGWVRLNWSGKWFFLASDSAASVIQNILMQPSGAGQMQLGACDNERFLMLGGAAIITADADVNRLHASGGVAQVLASGPTMAEAYALGTSLINLYRAATTIGTAASGTLNALLPTLAPTTANLNGGQLVYAGTSFGTLNAYAGVLDLTRATAPITITTANFYGDIVIRYSRNGPGLPTITNNNDWVKPRYEAV